ncbi:TPA: hypothetical protein ACF2DE_002873 [Clostridium perfringens]
MAKRGYCKYCEKRTKESEKIQPSGIGIVHIECHRKALLERFDEEIVEEKISNLIQIQQEKLRLKLEKEKLKSHKKLQAVKNGNLDKEHRSKFYEWVNNSYDINLTKYAFVRIAEVVNGTYKGLKEGISYEDLLIMFQKQKSNLDRIADDKKRKGNEFKNNLNRFYFDLAVIVGKYDSYKKWKEQQKQKVAAMEDIKKAHNSILHIESKKVNKKISENNDNINDLLDEVF